jgi:hypothetical protein
MGHVAPPQSNWGRRQISRYSRTSVARVLSFRDHRIEFAMVQLRGRTLNACAEVDPKVVLFPTRATAHVKPQPQPQAQSGWVHAAGRQAGVRTHAIRGVEVLEVARPLSDVVEELDQTIQVALADQPRGVVCDLSSVHEGFGPEAVEMLATAGQHVRDWPGIPLAVACPDPWLRTALEAHALGRHLIVAESLFSAMSQVLATPVVAVESLRLAPHPTAPRASRNFVTRTLLDWQLNHVIPFASLVVSELVASSMNADGDIHLSVAWNLGALRLTVQDQAPAQRGQGQPGSALGGRGRTVVAGLSRAFGVLPTTNAGRVVWAVLDAPRRPQSPKRDRSATGFQVAHV